MSSTFRPAAVLTVVIASAMLGRDAIDAHQRYIDGVFVQTARGPVELITYAEPVATGLLRLANGSMEDVPTIGPRCRVLVSLPAWRPVAAIVATEAIFDDQLAERRTLGWMSRPLNIYATDMEFRDLAKEKDLQRLLKGAKASDEKPAYLFIVLSNNLTAARQIAGLVRYYPLLIDTSAPPPTAGPELCGLPSADR